MLMDANKWLVSAALPLISLNCIAQQTKQPNIILIVADDLGYSVEKSRPPIWMS